jgi:predicted peroxiredoxin
MFSIAITVRHWRRNVLKVSVETSEGEGSQTFNLGAHPSSLVHSTRAKGSDTSIFVTNTGKKGAKKEENHKIRRYNPIL